MLRTRASVRDRLFYRLLRTQGPNADSLCKKLGDNVKNVVLLTEDELRELWKHVNDILVDIRKFYTNTSCEESRRKNSERASNLMLVRTITSLALETIVQRSFVSNILLQSMLLLHSTILPNICHDQTENEISYLLENWWQLDLIWKEKMILNAIMYLIRKSRFSLQHVKRLYSIRSAIALLRCTENIEELLTLVREKTVMSLHEGQLLLLHLFTLGDGYILRIHDNIKVMLQHSNTKLAIDAYAALYAKAWLSGTEKVQQFIQENCIRDIVYHCFRAHRDTKGKGILGENLFSFLTALHDNESSASRLMVHNECASLLWQHLKAPGSFIRCNAAEILFITAPVQYECESTVKKRSYLSKHHNAITQLLKDSNSEVCNITINGMFEMLKQYWSCIPNTMIQNWLGILLSYTKSASNPEIRANVFIGLRKIMIRDDPHMLLEDFLPNFMLSIYDEEKVVLKALIKFLWHAQDELEIPFWKIVPMDYIFNRLETTEDSFLLRELIKLVWLRISSDNMQDEIKDEIVHAGTSNINAIRRFCLHSKSIVDYRTSVKLIETLLFLIKKEMNRVYRLRSTRTKTDSSGDNSSDSDSSEDERGDVDHEKIQIYIDVMATLMEANAERQEFYSKNEKILKTIVEALPEIFIFFKESPLKGSVMVLFSTIPSTYFDNNFDMMEMLIHELCDFNNSDDVLLALIYVFTKWNKSDIVLSALTTLLTTSLRMTEQDEETDSDTEIFQVNENGLELSLRILRHLLHAEYKPVLMHKYHNDLVEFWKALYIIRTFIENELDNKCNIRSPIVKDTINQIFKEYVSMISILHKKDVFDATKHLTEILSWVKRIIEPHILSIDVRNLQDHQICINIVRSIFHAFNSLMKDYNSTPKLCCDIVLLYCHFLTLASGVVFLKDAFDGMFVLLEFSKMAYENGETSLLGIVVPNFISVTLTALNRYSKDILPMYIDSLKVLHELTNKYFSVTSNHALHISYMSTLLNTAVSNITTMMTPVLEYSRIKKANILFIQLPYLAKRIVRIILSTVKYQKVCIQVLSKTITNYTETDMFSALLIMYKMLSSTDKKFINGLKNLTVATKQRIRKQSYNGALDRSLKSALNIITNAILKH
ncbi:condensin-2 complex subunit G2-like [Ceratina calcarata]|uniref:Condensin-2 complex subunit G2-like n=1 Tax=Ceratina calcarata TaxID=156304 RepID=A0AAJ7RZ68_9HYME|nr:condensin-2 complex subunit G2-like [Ceratina calcarata]XP_026668010.1 condensin-2 complex subunit G2-like [Ceratina calcarata]XP_026668011.1 condensin-2 complex subunit G2-like [Ceratina calcarata]XP_026668012.1 condensin-2 complex subunit G2-like [Ceratina calcarata]XP_026668013.1 condensin-2 complex subunit G2-like [Ceratina calcarata]